MCEFLDLIVSIVSTYSCVSLLVLVVVNLSGLVEEIAAASSIKLKKTLKPVHLEWSVFLVVFTSENKDWVALV